MANIPLTLLGTTYMPVETSKIGITFEILGKQDN